MRRLLVWALLSVAAFAQSSTNIGGTEGAQQVFNGTLYANAFGAWSVPQGDAGQFTWSNPNICTNLQGLTFRLFVVGLPITIVDANPALTENTTITAVHVLPSQCNIVTAPLVNQHYSFRIVSGTFGVQEAINYAKQNNLATTVHVTQAWTRLGGQTSMITGAQGNANIGILDERNTVALAFYAWNGATYNQIPIGTAAQPILCTFNTPTTNWSCAHNLGTLQVQVEYLNLTSTKIFPDSPGPCPDVNTCNATFLQPQAGYMLVSFAGNVGQTQLNPNPVVINPVSSQTITGNQPLNVTGPTTVLNNTLTVTGDNATSLGGSLSAKRIEGACSADVFGATGNGSTDDTAALNSALAACHQLWIPAINSAATTYMVNCDGPTNNKLTSGGLLPLSNSYIAWPASVTLKCTPSTVGYGAIWRLKDVSNVILNGSGGTLDGNRSNVTAGGGTQYMYGVAVVGSTDVILENIVSQNFWGDGYFFDRDGDTLVTSQRVKGSKLRALNNRRNGASFISLTGFKCTACSFETSNGTSPQAGIDLEPAGFGAVKNWECDNCDYLTNNGNGLSLIGNSGTSIEDVRSIGGKADGNCVGNAIGGDAGCAGVFINNNGASNDTLSVLVSGMTLSNNGPKGEGIYVQNALDGSVQVYGNKFYGNGDGTDSQAVVITSVGVDMAWNTFTSLPGVAAVATHAINDNSNTRFRFHDNKFCSSATGTVWLISSATNPQYFDNSDCSATYQPGRGLWWVASTDQTNPNISQDKNAPTSNPGADTYIANFGHITPDGSMSIGEANPSSFGYLDIRGGNQITGGGAASVMGIRMRRGNVSGGYEDLLKLDNFATFLKPIVSSVGPGTAPLSFAGRTVGQDPVSNLTVTNHPIEYNCGTTVTCAATLEAATKIVRGSAPLTSATPSTATITALPFTGTNTYNCTVTNETTQANPLKYSRSSASSIVITGPNTVTDTVSFICVGT